MIQIPPEMRWNLPPGFMRVSDTVTLNMAMVASTAVKLVMPHHTARQEEAVVFHGQPVQGDETPVLAVVPTYKMTREAYHIFGPKEVEKDDE